MKKTINVLLLLLAFQISAQNSDLKTPNLIAANSLLKEKINKHAPDLDKYYQLSSNINGKTKKEIEIDLDKLENQSSISIEKLKNLNHNIKEQILVTDNEKNTDFNSSIKNLKDKIEADLVKFKDDKSQTLEKLKNLDIIINKLYITEYTDSTSILIKNFNNEIDVLKKEYKKLKSINNGIIKNKNLIEEIKKFNEVKIQYNNTKKEFESLIKNIPEGEYSFTYNDNRYFAFIADPLVHNLKITDSSNQKNNGISVNKLFDLEKNNINNIEMITNGGMFESNMQPVGLMIKDEKIKKEINLGVERPNSTFFMLPNGVFYIQNDSVFVTNTPNYILKKPHPDFATQSGPMLVDNGNRHSEFKYKSQNVYNRSGVGILPNNRAIFIISEKQNTNFFDFSSIFMDIFSCKNALYLDGAISEMYLKNFENITKSEGRFGSLIYVVRKKKQNN
jgi:uncharacterized protein YigE (DUF2233 family)